MLVNMRKKSITLIGVGATLVLLAIIGALFPFVPIVFSDAKFLSEYVGRLPDVDQAIVAPQDDEPTPWPQNYPGTGDGASSVPYVSPEPLSATPTPTTRPQHENMLFIEKIGVSVPLVEGKDAGALLYGAWRYPGTSRPNQGSNTVIFGHRFRYLPPNNTTFYKLDKLAVGDAFSVTWGGKTYRYTVAETKIIQPNDFSVVQETEKSTVTLITCSPLFSTKERLVVVGELVP